MPRPRAYKTEAVVLRQRRIGEADKIVTFLCAHRGKVEAVAKGVRRTKSRLAGHVEPLTLGSYLLAEGRDLDIVTQAETIDAFAPLRADVDRLGRALYCAELVDRLLPVRSEAYAVFSLLGSTLKRLSHGEQADTAVRFFEMRLLDELGYRPQLSVCALCGRRLEPVENFWSSAAGGAVGPECGHDLQQPGRLGVNALKVLRLLQSAPFAEAARVRIDGALAAEIETFLGAHLRHVLEREVRSAEFVETLRRLHRRSAKSASPPPAGGA